MSLTIQQRNWVEENIGLVGAVIKRCVHNIDAIGIFTYDDLFQIGCVGLCKAAVQMSESESTSTYAFVVIRNEIYTALEYATCRRKREILSDPDLLPGVETDPASNLECADLNRLLDNAQRRASGVTAKGIRAIRLHADGYTSEEIGTRMGAPTNHITAWISKARRFLRTDPAIVSLWGEHLPT